MTINARANHPVLIEAQFQSTCTCAVRNMIFAGETVEEAEANLAFSVACSVEAQRVALQRRRVEPFSVGTVFRTDDGYKLRLMENGTVTDGDLCYDNVEQFLLFVEAAQIMDEAS